METRNLPVPLMSLKISTEKTFKNLPSLFCGYEWNSFMLRFFMGEPRSTKHIHLSRQHPVFSSDFKNDVHVHIESAKK